VISTWLPREFHVAADDERTQRRLRSVGMPFPGNEIRITNDDGTECRPGEAGEITVRSPAMFRGYWNDDVATASVIRDGWCHTGDIGVPDDTWGEAISAVVVPAEGATVVAVDLQEHVRSRLARYKAPQQVIVTAELPVLPTGKIDKKLLRACYSASASAGQAVEISG
jgi:acyl-CoA synthetase (AMP-forming)/AMP-acid ligase II